MDTIIKLGGCDIIEKNLQELEEQKQKIKDMKYSETTKRPIQDSRGLYNWKTVIVHLHPTSLQEQVRFVEEKGYEFTEETTQRRMFFRKLKI